MRSFLLFVLAVSVAAAETHPVLQKYCAGCHGKAPTGGISFLQIAGEKGFVESFAQWEKVASAIEERHMPPAKMPQPTDAERHAAVDWVRSRLNAEALNHSGDPGSVTLRRLTTAEYGYSVRDLTGLDYHPDKSFADDAVGGEGFTNFGDVQFVQDSHLERYLEAAKRISAHLVIGSGPLQFFADPGKSGFELSAIHRIQKVYHENGFRSASGEGGKPFGLDRYSQAIMVLWRYKNRARLGQANLTLTKMADQAGVSTRFAAHLWKVLNEPNPTYPTSEAVALWRKFPTQEAAAKQAALELQQFIVDWPRVLFGAGAPAEGGAGDERNFVLSEDSLKAKTEHKFRYPVRDAKRGGARVYISVRSMNPSAQDQSWVVWKNATARFRDAKRGFSPSRPLKEVLTADSAAKLNFGKLPNGESIDPNEFALTPDNVAIAEIDMPADAAGVEITIDAALGPSPKGDAVLRAMVTNSPKPFTGVPMSVLLGQPKGAGFAAWKDNVLLFASKLPASSHGEPTPADKDPIPAPYNNIYNQPERDSFHVNVKYYRDDKFLYDNVLDDQERAIVDWAWNDLLSSFEYHQAYFAFVNDKYKLGLKKKINELTPAEIAAIPAEPRQYVAALRKEYDAVHNAQLAAQPRHLDDLLKLASRAWRRDLTAAEKDSLRGFYTRLREEFKLDHDGAIRSVMARVLVSPAFLYRLEQQPAVSGTRPLSQFELASRLSYFLWSSPPDDELIKAARLGQLATNAQLNKQVQRMLAHPKARRFATEFFGQWLGFYKFDQYSGIDTSRFPEFNQELKQAMYDEAVSFFEHIVRQDRPIGEMLTADYTFANQQLARHYGFTQKVDSKAEAVRVDGVNQFERGGILGLGAVHVVTSAPLRTSPVKRGEWVLRRVLGTPTPPPPADAGMIPADPKNFGGLSLKERLQQHQRNATCAGCHSRIDPLGFPLEKFDAIGRLRATYEDGKPIDAAAVTHNKVNIDGRAGLSDYLKQNEKLVVRNFSKKLLGYALGRTMAVGDQPLIDQLSQAGSEARVSQLITQIVTSKQFRNRREGDDNLSAQPAKSETKQGGL